MKKITILALVVALFVLPVAFALCTGSACVTSTGSVSQTAILGGSTGVGAPEIKFVWVLPDEDLTTDETQLYPALSAERNDIYACIVVSDPQGRDDIMNVYADVYHPTGTADILPCVLADNDPDKDGLYESKVCDETQNNLALNNAGAGYGGKTDGSYEKTGDLFKYQVHAVKMDPVSDRVAIENCKNAAVTAGLITQNDAHLSPGTVYQGIDYWIFDQPEWYMYKVYLPMLYHQPAGWYTVKAWATDKLGHPSAQLSTTFEWVSTVAMEIDFFGGLNYGTLSPSVYKVIQGDWIMSTADGKPTVKNEGNEPIHITVGSNALIGTAFKKSIDDFDVKWNPEEIVSTPNYGYQTYTAGQTVSLEDPLELCQTEKIDFSAHADAGLPEDTYIGSLILTVSSAR